MLIQVGKNNAADYASPAMSNPTTLQGVTLVMRYITPSAGLPYADGKCLSVTERDTLLNMGKSIALIWETTAVRALDGANAGTTDGAAASAAAARLSYPTTMPIIVTFDFDVTAKTRDVAIAYWRAFQSACAHPLGLYGDYDIIAAVGNESVLTVQANAAGWSWDWIKHVWRGTHPLAHVQQKLTKNGIDPGDVVRQVTAWGEKPKAPKPSSPSAPEPTLNVGMQGNAVLKLQQHLHFWGWYMQPLDGQFGSFTETAVKSMQKSLKVTTDGIYGPVTAKAYAKFLTALKK
jgi:hypothetical protein